MPKEGKKKKILIAEDERPMATALQLKLNKSGFETDIAYNGQEALNKIKDGHFDLVLLDLMMPIMDGFEFLEELRKKKISIPVIVSSNLSQAEDKEKVKALGAVDYFVKSNIPINDVVTHIKNALK